MCASVLRLGTGRLDSNETIAQHRSQKINHLPVAVLHALELAVNTPKRTRQLQPWNGAPLRKAPGFLASTDT